MNFRVPSFRAVFLIVLLLAGSQFLLFGFHPVQPDGDSIEYLAYAKNMALGNGYSLDGKEFSAFREPGYPSFILLISLVGGIGNTTMIAVAQIILLAGSAFLVFRIGALLHYRRVGFCAGIACSVMPPYIYYANLPLSETLVTFLLVISLFLVLKVAMGNPKWGQYILLGGVFAGMTLTRAHLIFLPFFVGLVFVLLRKPWRNIAVFLSVFIACVGGWVGYVYAHTGVFTITQGRQELHLYARATRSTLSYGQQVRYLHDWLSRSALGGVETALLKQYEPAALARAYNTLLAKGVPAATIEADNIALIEKNIGHFFFGNGVEWVKMMFAEHLFPPVSPLYGRTLRAGLYLALYAVFLAGIIRLVRRWSRVTPDTRIFLSIAGIYILYHWLALPFFDVIPRFNTPYLIFYLMIGLIGLTNPEPHA